MITPARFSVLSAVEGLNGVPHLGGMLGPRVVLVAGAILLALFLAQGRGTKGLACALFGPVIG